MNTEVPVRSMAETDLRRGIDHNEFVVFYQPIVNLEGGRIVSFEALIRWKQADGLIDPSSFLKLAEQSDVMLELGALVLDQGCQQTMEWQRAGMEVGLSVNLSARELVDVNLVARIAASLESSGLDPTRLWLEVTETVLVEELELVGVRLRELAALGISIAIDDFGTGWASLLYLRHFPVRVLKIDAVFVSGIERKANDSAIVHSVISLGAELGLTVVAEGVERFSQEAALREFGCALGQGFLYGKPTPANRVPLDRMNRMRARDPAGSDFLPSAVSALNAFPSEVGGTGENVVSTMLRGLLRIRSAEAAAHLIQAAVRGLGGKLVYAAESGADALPIDLSLGEGEPLLAAAEPLSTARMQLERFLPRLVEDARQAVNLLRYSERLMEESNHDLLTGLANRRVLDRVLPRAMGGIIIMIDLDHFKSVNDTAGHQAGDEVLASFGRMLAHDVRASDVCCRLGGEEFVIVAAHADVASGVELVVRLRASWSKRAPFPVTFSAGVAAVGAAGGSVALIAADQALYRAKANGRNRTEIDERSSEVDT